VRSHHERYDGRGYPDGLKGDEIPFIARIISVSDTFDAITSDRPYRQKKMAEIAVQIIKDNSGTQFDPIVVSAFLLAYKKGNLKNVI
jgi:HD-GYP domain-containing protein (c-di-GMP phosphodiesterase class II)